ncbi:MAG: signal peptidase I [Clostridiaceae bacterium]|nr:signal peptidase I [Clostridiaceae bacterium]
MENKTEKSILREIIDWVLLFVIAFLAASIVQSELFALTEVNMSSMRDTLAPGDKLIMNKLSYVFKEPKRGDIIIFLRNEPVNGVLGRISIYVTDIQKKFNGAHRSNRLIKRVIGVPGDEIEIRDNVLFVNGVAQDESYARIDPYANIVLNGDMEKLTVPPGKLFVLGDNRGQSSDSREFGLIDRSWVEGKAVFRIYPFNKAGAVK